MYGYETYVDKEKPVAIIGADYGFAWDWDKEDEVLTKDNQKLIEHWNDGGLVTISWNARNPWYPKRDDPRDKPRIPPKRSLKEIAKRWEDGLDPVNVDWDKEGDEADADTVAKRWKIFLNHAAKHLAELQEENVIVLWRPFNEMNGDWFWWGYRPDDNDILPDQQVSDFRALWQHMHNYFTNIKESGCIESPSDKNN